METLNSIKSYLKNLFSPPKEKPLDPVAVMKGTVAGAVGGLGLEISGPETYLHENGHRTAMELLYQYPPGQRPEIVDYQFENVRNFVTHPSADTLNKLVNMYTPQQNVGGYTTWGNPDGLSPVGKVLGQNGSAAAVNAAGSLSELGLSMVEFAAGFKLRKTHPVIGYTLMTMSAIPYANAVPYILSPLQGASATLSGNTGNDWVNFAKQSGINPAITGVLAAASLPAVAAISFLFSRHEKEKALDRLALAQLVQSGKISEEDLEKRFNQYERKSKIEKLEQAIQTSLTENKPQEARKLSAKLQTEYARFSDSLVSHYKPLVEEQKRTTNTQAGFHPLSAMKEFVRHLRASSHENKLETAFKAGVTGSFAAESALQTTNTLLPGIFSGIAHVFPLLGIPATAATAYRAAQLVRNKAVSKNQKATSAALPFFSGMATAGALIPWLGLPFLLLGLGGIGAIGLTRHLAAHR